MTFYRVCSLLAAWLPLLAVAGRSHAQALSPGASYVLETRASPSCRAAVLHVVREGDTLSGVVFFKDGTGLSSVMGQVNGRDFNWTMTPVRGDGPKGEVSGQVTAEGALSARLQGTNCTLTAALPVFHDASSGTN